MRGKWRVRYEYQAGSWIVYRGNRILRDYFPAQEDAVEAAREKNQEDLECHGGMGIG